MPKLNGGRGRNEQGQQAATVTSNPGEVRAELGPDFQAAKETQGPQINFLREEMMNYRELVMGDIVFQATPTSHVIEWPVTRVTTCDRMTRGGTVDVSREIGISRKDIGADTLSDANWGRVYFDNADGAKDACDILAAEAKANEAKAIIQWRKDTDDVVASLTRRIAALEKPKKK